MLRLIAYLVETISWLRIFLSPFLFGVLVGGICYFSIGGTIGAVLFVLLTVAGGIAGVLFARYCTKRKGATTFMSAVNASPDIDKIVGSDKKN